MFVNYYQVLGFNCETPAEYAEITLGAIKKAYREKMLRVHPDKVKDSDGKASGECHVLMKAYEILADSDERKTFDDQLKRNFTAYCQKQSLHFHSSLEQTDRVDVTSLIHNTDISADYLLEQATTNLNFAQALMSANSVLMTFTLQQQYQLLFCLIEHNVPKEAILSQQNIGDEKQSNATQSNAKYLVSLLKADDDGTASKECLSLLSTRLMNNERNLESYFWILDQLYDEDIRTIALSDGARWPLVLHCLEQSSQSFDIIDIICLMKRFESQREKLQETYLTAAPDKRQQFEDCLVISESKDKKAVGVAIQRLVPTAQPVLIVKLARSFDEQENQPITLIKALFQKHSDLTTVYSEIEFIGLIIMKVLMSEKNEINRLRRIEEYWFEKTMTQEMERQTDNVKKKNEFLLKMIFFMADSEEANKSTVVASAILSNFPGSVLRIDHYTKPCQAQWLRLFFPKTDPASDETVELFVSLIKRNPVNHLLDFLTGNELISRKFLQIFHQTFDSYQDGENIIKRIVPTVDALGLKKFFLQLFPNKQNYYAKFEQVKKCANQCGKIKEKQFGDFRDVLSCVQEKWFYIKFAKLNQALSILPNMFDYVIAKNSSDKDHQLLKIWINNLPVSDNQEELFQAVIHHSKVKKNYQDLFIKLLDPSQPEHFSHRLFQWLWMLDSGVEWLKEHLPACQIHPSLKFSQQKSWRVLQLQYEYNVINPKDRELSSLRELLKSVTDTDQFLTDLCKRLTTIVVDKELLQELEGALQNHPTLLLVLLSRIETGDIPSVGELSLGDCRQKALSKKPKQPEVVFLSCAKQFLHEKGHRIAGDQLLIISQVFGADIEPEITQLRLLDKLNTTRCLVEQVIEPSRQSKTFSLAEVDYENQWIDIVDQLKQLAASSWRESMSCAGMQALYQNLLELNQDKLAEQSQSISQALLRRFPHEHPKNLIRWVLQIALDQDGSQLSELAIRAWLTQPDFIDHFTGTSSFDDVMLSIIASDSSSPIIIELKQQFISCLIKKPKLSVSFSQHVLADPKKLTDFVAGLTKHLTLTESSSLTVDQWLNVYTQLLSQLATLGNWVDLLPIVTKGLISVVTFIVAHDRFAEIPRGGTWIKQSLSFDFSRSVRPPNNEACQAMHAIICLLLLMQHPGDAADFFNQELLSGLTSLAARQSDFPDVIHDFVIQRLIQMNLFPDLLQKIESLFLDDEQEAQGLLNYLAKKSVKSIDAEEKESASQSEAQTSLLGCVQKEAYVNADDVIIEQFQRLKEEQLVHQSTPYLDRLLGLLDLYLYRSMDWSNERKIQHLGIISALLKQLPNATSTISKECVQLLQKNIIKERVSLQVHHASEEALPIPVMDEEAVPSCWPVNYWHDCLSDTQKTQVLSRVDNAESLEQHYHHHFQDFLHLKSYVDLKFYQDWHLKFIADKGDYDSALYRLNQLLHQYVQTCASLDVSTRRTQIRRLLQFVWACDSLDYLSGELKEALQHRIENEYEFVYHHLSHRPGAALNLRTSQDHSSSPLDQRSWYRKLWSWMHRFLNQEHVESVYINASRQPVKYALVDEAHFCQHLLTLEQLDYGQWQTLLTFYQKAMDANEGLTEAVDEKEPPVEPSPNQRYMKDVAGKICQRLVGDEPDKAWYKTSRTYLATNFAKVKPILQQLYRSHQSFRKTVEALANDKAVSDPCSLKGKLYRALITWENVEEASGRVQGSSELPKAAGSSHSFRQRHGMFSCWLGKKAPANTLSAAESEETLLLSVQPGSSSS